MIYYNLWLYGLLIVLSGLYVMGLRDVNKKSIGQIILFVLAVYAWPITVIVAAFFLFVAKKIMDRIN